MKKTTLWLAMVGALGLAGCDGGGGESGGTTSPEPQPKVLPGAGVYLPVLMNSQQQLIPLPSTDYHAAAFVYPATAQGVNWVLRLDEKSGSSNTYVFPYGNASSDKAQGYPLALKTTLSRDGVITFGDGIGYDDELFKQRSVMDGAGASKLLWVLDYRKTNYRINGAPAFQNWGGQIALQPMVTENISAGVQWYYRGVSSASPDLFQMLETKTSSNGQGIKLEIHFIGESCIVTGETESNSKGMNKLTLTGWKDCIFAPIQPAEGRVYEGHWRTEMRKFIASDARVTAYLAMRPGENGQKATLLLGIPDISTIMPFVLEVQPL